MRLTFVNIKIHIVPFKNQTENTITSTNLLMCKFFGFCTVSIELWANHPNCAFPEKFETRKFDKILMFYALKVIAEPEFC